jgi:sporulation protein YlmC with PRC-barrel domain
VNDTSGPRELRLERLLGRQVHASNGRRVGRIEEFRAERRGNTLEIREVVIGVAGLLERLGVGVKLLVGAKTSGYVARWEQVDVTDPMHPKITCRVEDLRRL